MNPAGEDIRDVAAPVAVPWLEPWMAVLLAVAAAAALAVGGWLLWRWIRRRRAAPPPSAKEDAMRRLEVLAGRWSEMDGYHFAIAVSDVLRDYLTRARGLAATSQTSQEFLADLRQRNEFSEPVADRLARFLGACDRLKYTPAGKAEEPNRELLEQARVFIREDRAG